MEEKKLVLDVEDNPKKISQWVLFAIQHILAMLVACITVPLLTGLPVAATLVSAGVGTLIYIAFTRKKSPVFLSSSFAYIAPIQSALICGTAYSKTGGNYLAVIIGMVLIGLVYSAIAIIVKFVGTNWLNKVLPPIVVGPVIMVIGLGLAGSAINNLTTSNGSYNLIAIFCGLFALIVTAIVAYYGKGKFIGLIPFVFGMVSGYLLAVIITLIGYTACGNVYFNIVDFSPLINIFGKNFSFASIFNYNLFVPNHNESFLFLRFDSFKNFSIDMLPAIVLLFVPVSLVTVCEHIGDHENLGHILGRDLLNKEPGMTRTLLGDGIATAASGALCGAANTTYGENVAVIGTSKIASVNVVMLAAILSVAVGFITPFTALLQTVPACVTGGVSLILYGFIANSGVRMLVHEKIDLGSTRNVFISSAILVSGIGGLTLGFAIGKAAITITSTAVAMIVGILLNVILKEKKDKAETKTGN